jgi:hypothetical protein
MLRDLGVIPLITGRAIAYSHLVSGRTLKMNAVCSSEFAVKFYETKWRQTRK